MADRAFLERLTKELADKGKLIEAGWVALRLNCIHPNAPPEQLQEMRMAYLAGAQHLFSSIVATMDEDKEPTPADLNRMELIHKELEAFTGELKSWASKGLGR